MFKKDNILIGIAIGIVLPLALFAFVTLPLYFSGKTVANTFDENFQLFCIAFNAFVFRWITVKKELDKMGKGVLIVTLLYALAWVITYHA